MTPSDPIPYFVGLLFTGLIILTAIGQWDRHSFGSRLDALDERLKAIERGEARR